MTRNAPKSDHLYCKIFFMNQTLIYILIIKHIFQAATLTTILDVDVALRNNLMNMHEIVQEVQEEVSLR